MGDYRLLFHFLVCLLLSAGFFQLTAESEGSKAAEVEKIVRQQRELEADGLVKKGSEDFKAADYAESAEKFKKAIHLYTKSSSLESRIIIKMNQTKLLLSKVYKLHGDATLKDAERKQSVKLFDKAEKLYILAKKTQQDIKKIR